MEREEDGDVGAAGGVGWVGCGIVDDGGTTTGTLSYVRYTLLWQRYSCMNDTGAGAARAAVVVAVAGAAVGERH